MPAALAAMPIFPSALKSILGFAPGSFATEANKRPVFVILMKKPMPNSQHRLFFSEIMFLTDFKQKDSVRLCGDTQFKGKPDIYFDRHLGFDGYDT